MAGFCKRLSCVSVRRFSSISIKEPIPIRDYYQHINYCNFQRNFNGNDNQLHLNFFTKQFGNESLHYFENLNNFNPTLINSIGRYFIINYKLNYFPYYDLNLVNVYTDLNQSLHNINNLIFFYKSILSDEMFAKIKIFLLPLYQNNNEDYKMNLRKIKKKLPENVFILDDLPVFKKNDPMDRDNDSINVDIQNLVIQDDPIYILLLNDIMKYMPHDTVMYSSGDKMWKQLYVQNDPFSKENKLNHFFTSDLDYWCNQSIVSYFNDNPKSVVPNEMYNVPTRLIQLFNLVHKNFPEHNLFAIDNPIKLNASFSKKMIDFLTFSKFSNDIYRSSSLTINNDKTISYKYNFGMLQSMYDNINEPSRHAVVDDLSSFIEQYSNIEEDGANYKELEKIATLIKCTSLVALYTT